MSEATRATVPQRTSTPPSTASSTSQSSSQTTSGHAPSLPAGYLEHYGIQMKRAEPAPAAPVSEGYLEHYGVQKKSAREDEIGADGVRAAAVEGVSGGGAALPHLDQIQRSFGAEHDLSGVRAHVGGAAAKASDSIGAEAYATGNHVAFRGSPSVHLAAHEAAHVVQQRAGVHLSGGVGHEGDPWERHADAVADRVASGRSAADLLGGMGGAGGMHAVQRKTSHPAAPAVDPALVQQAQKDAEALSTALTANDVATIRRILGQDAASLGRIKTAYEATGGRHLSADVLAHTQGDLHTFAVSQLTRAGAVDKGELSDAGDARTAAMHDGGNGGAIGQGDEVFDANNQIIAVFPSTAEGVVEAAQYELHRGEKRTLAEVMAGDTAGRTQRGDKAAIEGRNGKSGTNTDAKGAAPIGHITKKTKDKKGSLVTTQSAVGPIQAYLKAAAEPNGVAWCGSFATYVYHRAGIRVESMGWSHNVPEVLAKMGTDDQHGAYFRVTGTEGSAGGHKYNGTFQEGEYNPPTTEAPSKKNPKGRKLPGGQKYHNATQPTSALDFDMRAGDVFWMEHSASSGHVGIIIGVQKTAQVLTFVTIEGNASDQVRTHVRHINVDKKGKITSDVKGWGRPPELNSAAAPANPAQMPAWMTAASEHEDGNTNDR